MENRKKQIAADLLSIQAVHMGKRHQESDLL